MIFAVAGDWHGKTAWALNRIREVADRGVETLLHVGDFGIWPGRDGARYLREVERVCAERGVTIMVTPGNHEDWGHLMGRWHVVREERSGERDEPLVVSPHVLVLPRGFRWEMGGRSFVSLGGAASVDLAFRTQGRDWWDEEIVTQAEADACAAAGYADVMITHETPDVPYAVPVVADLLAHNPMGWADKALWYSAMSRGRVTDAMLGVGPRLLLHGHMHVAGEMTLRLPGRGYETTIWSLNRDGQTGNLRFLDLSLFDQLP